jgi:predicted ribosome quality control (RQC) complex YloA/Tae2 family protein
LLKSVLDRARPGQQQVQARDFETGAEVSIPLDPTLSPAANLEALFRRARKAQRRALRAAQQQGALEARREELDALRAELERAESLAAFSERPDVQRLLERHAPTAPRAPAAKPRPFRLGKREIPRRLAPRRYRSSDGLEIWVGRSDEGNDLLTTRLARGNDLFFHVSASPGSHVVLRTEGRVDPPSESLLEACELAVHASKQRRASRVDVLVTSIKNVRKPKGAKPGLVVVSGGKTLHLRHHPSRLERVLAARIDPEP